MEINLGDKKVLSGQADWFYLQPAPTTDLLTTSPSSRDPSRDHAESDVTNQGLGSKSLSEMMREKVTIQHRTTFSTFDNKKEIVSDIRRTASDSTKPAKPLKQKSKQQQTSDEDSSDNVFNSAAIHTHLSNIKGMSCVTEDLLVDIDIIFSCLWEDSQISFLYIDFHCIGQ